MRSATGRQSSVNNRVNVSMSRYMCNRHSLSTTVPGLVQANVYRVSDTPNRPIVVREEERILDEEGGSHASKTLINKILSLLFSV